jgi:bacillithiol system protein YtxJ
MLSLTSLEQFQTLLASGKDFIIFKHSGRCSISGGACKEVFLAIDELELDAIYMLDVLNTGDLKYEIADAIAVKHESPQVLIFV